MEFFRKGGGLDPIHNFEAHLLGLKSYGIFDEKEGYGHFGALFLKVYFKYGHFGCFWEVLFFNFFVTKNQMCLTGSITSKNKDGGVRPLTEEFHN